MEIFLTKMSKNGIINCFKTKSKYSFINQIELIPINIFYPFVSCLIIFKSDSKILVFREPWRVVGDPKSNYKDSQNV